MQSSAPYKSKCVLEFNVAVKRFEIKGSLKNYEKDVKGREMLWFVWKMHDRRENIPENK